MNSKIDRQQAYSGTGEIRSGHEFDSARLEAYLKENIDGFEGPLNVEQFKGGQSNPTYKLITPERSYVLRRKPPGTLLPSAHAVDREYRAIAALYPTGYPVAKPYLLCEDEAVIGTMFYVMGFADGRVIWYPQIPDVSGPHRGAVFDQLNDAMARLHMTDIDAVGLSDFGKAEGYVARQISRWSKQYRASETQKIAAMDRLMEWLPQAAPENTDTALVHGDFRLDNCVLHPTEPRIIAVLDWELSTLGDPIADFTYHMMQWKMPPSERGGGVGTLVGYEDLPGLPDMETYIEWYCRKTDRNGIPDIDIYMAYNFFRIAAILQGIVGRVRDGTAASPNAARMAELVEPLAQTAWGYAKKAGA